MPNSEKEAGPALSHHGILGQKWGVRRFQNKDGSYTAAGKKHRKTTSTISKYEKSGKASTKSSETYNVGKVHQYSVGGKVVTSPMQYNDFRRQEIDLRKTADGLKPVPDSYIAGTTFERVISDPYQNSQHDQFKITDLDLETCNPNWGRPGTISNCAKCAATLEMRMRGLDVHAGRSDFAADTHAMEMWFNGAQRVDYSFDSVQEALSSYGPETSGTLSIRYPNGSGGHALHWTNDSDGKFEIQDGQNGKRFSSFEDMAKIYPIDTTKPVGTYRLDECAWDADASSRDSVLRNDTSKGGLISPIPQVYYKDTGALSGRWVDSRNNY